MGQLPKKLTNLNAGITGQAAMRMLSGRRKLSISRKKGEGAEQTVFQMSAGRLTWPALSSFPGFFDPYAYGKPPILFLIEGIWFEKFPTLSEEKTMPLFLKSIGLEKILMLLREKVMLFISKGMAFEKIMMLSGEKGMPFILESIGFEKS